MHHLILFDVYVDGVESVTDIFYFSHVIRHSHVFLSDVVQLLSELKLAGSRICREDSFQILPRFFRCLHITNVTKHVIVDTCCQTVYHPTRPLLPCWIVDVYDVGWFVFERVVDIAPIPLTN